MASIIYQNQTVRAIMVINEFRNLFVKASLPFLRGNLIMVGLKVKLILEKCIQGIHLVAQLILASGFNQLSGNLPLLLCIACHRLAR